MSAGGEVESSQSGRKSNFNFGAFGNQSVVWVIISCPTALVALSLWSRSRFQSRVTHHVIARKVFAKASVQFLAWVFFWRPLLASRRTIS